MKTKCMPFSNAKSPSMEEIGRDQRIWLRGQFQNHQKDICQIEKTREVSDRISCPLSFDFLKQHITKFYFERVELIAILGFYYLQVCFTPMPKQLGVLRTEHLEL